MSMKRRYFLQFAGSTLATIGLSQFDLFRQGDQLRQALSKPATTKRVLLIGINNYEAAGIPGLKGCLTDVDLQRYLLIHRFGFLEDNIIVVSDNEPDRKPTRANILAAFETLIEQTSENDVVLIHYSGHGSRVRDPNPIIYTNTDYCEATIENEWNGTLVPNDAAAVEQPDGTVAVGDIMGRTIFLLMSALKTDNVTLVLDSCHSGAGTRGNSAVRAASSRTEDNQPLVPTQAELDYQQQWLDRLGWTDVEFHEKRQTGIAKGVTLGSAQCDQLAIDATIEDDLHAGGFTYLLTRYLWQQPSNQTYIQAYSSLQISTRSFAASKDNLTEQIPTFEFDPNRNHQSALIYFSDLPTPSAEAVITHADDPNTIEFWLGGISSQNLKLTEGLRFNVLAPNGDAVAELEQTSRSGLFAYGQLVSGQIGDIQPGYLLREQILGIPADPVLVVGVDASLGDQLESTRTELAEVNRVQVVSGTDAMDVLLGRFTEDDRQRMAQTGENPPPVNTIGLFTPDRRVFDRTTFGRIDEPGIQAVNRLQSRFKRLLAEQLLGVLLSGEGSPLAVSAEVTTVGGSGPSLQLASRGSIERTGTVADQRIPQFPSGSTIQISVENQERDPIYLSVFVISASGTLDILYPQNWDSPEDAAIVDANDTLTFPNQGDIPIEVTGSSGFPEVLILASTEPLSVALQGMKTIADDRGQSRGAISSVGEDDALGLLDALMGNLNDLSTRSTNDGTFSRSTGQRTINKSTLAVLSGVVEVVPGAAS